MSQNNFQIEYTPSLAPIQSACVDLLRASGRDEIRAAMMHLESEMAQLPQVPQPLHHHFTDGLYGREIFNPKGSFIVTKIHKEPNFSFVLRGRLKSISEDGSQIIEGPTWFATKPGTKRVLFAEEDTVFITVHPNPLDLRNIDELEARIIAPDFENMEVLP